MGGKAGTGRRLWLSRDECGDLWLWPNRPEFDGEDWQEAQGGDMGVWIDVTPEAESVARATKLRPGECIELREVRRVKGDDDE